MLRTAHLSPASPPLSAIHLARYLRPVAFFTATKPARKNGHVENLDERHVQAVRYLRTIRSIAQDRLPEADAIRIAIFILYLDIKGSLQEILYKSAGTDRSSAPLRDLADELDRAYLKESKRNRVGGERRLAFDLLSSEALASLLRETSTGQDPDDKRRQFDYLVDTLLDQLFSERSTLRIEKFAAQFAQPLIGKRPVLLDLGQNSSGELGARTTHPMTYFVPELLHGAELEVLLKLDLHEVNVARYMRSNWAELNEVDYCQFLSPRKDARVDDLKRAAYQSSPGNSGLAMAEWFIRHAHQGQIGVTLLTLRDCRDRGIRSELRRQLLSAGSVRAVIELPRRVTKESRQFMLVLDASKGVRSGHHVHFIDGRYCDSLRDETLDRIAAFVCAPLLGRSLNELESRWPTWREAMGSELAVRASKMFFGERQEARGLYQAVPLDKLLEMEANSLEPAEWIQPMEVGKVLAMLDPTPLRELLDSKRRCCAYVIGDNGVGKSFLLRGLLDHYMYEGRIVRALSSTVWDRFPGRLDAFPNYRYFGAKTTKKGISPRLLARQVLELLQTIHRNPERVEVLDKASELVGFRGRHFVLPENLASNVDLVADLRSIDEMSSSGLRSSDQPGFQRSESTVIVPFGHLSTGEQQMLLLLVRLVAAAEKGALFIIDEPEASLHVAWQRALPGVLNILRDAFHLQLAIATHSPVLLSAAVGDGNYRFVARGGVIEALPERSNSVERILFDGFGTYTDSSREVHERCAEIVAAAIEQVNLGQERAVDHALSELAEMRHVVTQSIPSLGQERTHAHLNLIDRAKLVLSGLDEQRISAERDA